MNKTTIWQRMGALLMALVLVLGMLPVSARAAETGWAIGGASRLSVQLTRRGTAGNYHYEVSFVTGNVAQNNAAYYWCDSLSEAAGLQNDDEIYTAYRNRTGSGTEEDPYKYTFDTTRATHISANEDVGLKVVVDGLWVKVTIPEGAAQVDLDTDLTDAVQDMGWRYTATWATESTLPETVQVGVPFNVTWEYKCVEEQGTGLDGKYMSCGAEAAVTFDDTWTGNVQELDDGRYVVTEKSAVTLTRVVSTGMGNTKRGTETRTASVVDTVFKDIQFNGAAAEAGKTTYVDSEDITLSVKCGVEDAAYMPGLAEGITWVKGENGIWTAKVPAGSYTIGGKNYTVMADTVKLAFAGSPKAYVDGGKTYVEFALVEEPASGIQSVLLDTSVAVQQTDGRWEIGRELTGQAMLTVTSNVYSQTSQTVDVIAPLAVTVIPAEEPDETGYIGVDELKVEASRDGTLKIGEDEIAVNAPSQIIEGNVGKYSKKNWTYTDDLGRVATGTMGAYIVDTEAPVITISETELSGYRAEDTTITVSVDDAGSGVDSAEVKYTLNDDAGEQNAVLNENNEATIVLANEQELKKISVYAVDKMGNEAEEALTGSLIIDTKDPEISLSISAETDGKDNAVTGTYNSKDGKTWLILESPVTSEAAAVTTFSIHATAADNLGMTNMAGWTNENGAWTKITEVAQVANHIAETEVKLSVPVVKDNAGNYPESLELPIGENQILTLAMNGDGTAYEAVVYIDRRYPGDGDGIPTVTFTTTAEPKETFEDTGVKLYNEASMTFSVEVTDNGSGFASGTLVLDKDGELKFLNGNSTNYGDGKYSITLVSAEQNENNELQLKLVVEDNVRNAYAYYHMFAFDNQAPRMTFAFDREYNHVEGGAYYFNADVTATVTVDELNFVSDSTKVEQSGGTLVQNGQVYTVKFDTEGEKTLTASSKDLAGNDSGKLTHEIGETFIVDKGAPVILVNQSTEDTNGAKDNGDIHYFNGAVTYSFAITDDNLSNDGGSAKIEYTINGVTTTKTLSDLDANADNTVYTDNFTLEDGQTLTALSVYAVDNAGNSFVRDSSSNVTFGEDGVAAIGKVVVDTTAPVVTITKNAEPVNTSVEHFNLYDGEVTYTISVADVNLDSDSDGAVYTGTYAYTNADGSAPEDVPQITWENPYEGTFTVEDGQRLTDVVLTIADAAGNVPVAMADEQWRAAGDSVTYKGNDVVVDTTAPKAELSFKSLTDGVELKGYYTNGTVAYLQIDTPTTTETLTEVPEKVQVQATLTIIDYNLSAEEGITNALAQAEGWELSCEPDATEVNDSSAKAIYTKTLEVQTNKTMAVDLDFQIQDLVNNLLTKENTTVAPINDMIPGDFLTVTGGKLTGTVTLDRRQPTSLDTEIPEIQLTTDAEAAYTMSDGTALYDSDSIPTYELEVHDGAEGKDKENAGLHSVKSEDTAQDFLTVENVDETLEDRYVRSYSNDIEVAQNGDAVGEQNDATITVEAEDNVGNKITHQKTFGVDILAPRVTVTCDNNDVLNERYFKKARVATITVEDINFNVDTTTVDTTGGILSDWTSNEDGSIHTATVTYNTDGTYSLSVEVTDLAGNTTQDVNVDYSGMVCPKEFVIDTKKPIVKVTMSASDGDGVTKSNDGKIYYFNGKKTYEQEGGVRFDFQIADANLTMDKETDDGTIKANEKIKIEYTIENYAAKEEEVTEEIVVNEEVKLDRMTVKEQGKHCTYIFNLVDGQMLTSLSIEVMDCAGNSFVLDETSDIELDENGKFKPYIVVDMTPPEVTISKTANPVNTTVDGVDLYNGEATYTINVTDANLDSKSNGAVYTIEYTYEDANYPEKGEQEVRVDKDDTGWVMPVMSDDTYQYSFTLTDGQRFTGATVTIADAAGNKPEAAGSDQWIIDEDGIITYNSNHVVVDTTAPKAELSFESLTDGVTLDNYYTNDGNKGVTYLKISTPTVTDVDVPDTVEVHAKLNIKDRNLSTMSEHDHYLQSMGWERVSSENEPATYINTDVEISYIQKLTVKTNDTKAVDLAFQIQDLVNNLLTKDNTTVAMINNTVPGVDFLNVTKGKLTGTITLDRRQPTSGGDDESAPSIELTPSTDAVGEVGGNPLYNLDTLPTFAMTVRDGDEDVQKDKENAGLKSVTIDPSEQDFITISAEDQDFKDFVRLHKGDIIVAQTTGVYGEKNDVTIQVDAVDNVGNHITHVEPLAVDTLAPRVTVTCTDEHNDVRNERYFKTERVATITVEELNFDESRTTITSDGGGTISGWTDDPDGITHTATVSYTTDGTYSLSVAVTDLAGNTTTDDEVTYNMQRPKDFVVDLTMPEIHVTYNPAKESGVYNGVLFYNELQHVTVTIDELNFDVQGLATEFPAGYQLSNFDSDDISHSAHVTFDNGNNYKFSIEFVDLAGNIAEAYTSPTFSVDCNAPVIDIVEANVSQEYLQPLGDELELVLQVTDDENNLAECNLVLTHVNNAFEQTVVSGDVYYTRSSADENESVTFTFKDFPYEKIYDGIYTVELKAKDHAGNNVELAPPIQFSMNRFGSTFVYGDEFTKDFLTAGDDGVVYHNNVDGNLVIQEINPTRVYTDDSKAQEGSSVTMVVNGQSTMLVQGQDYKLTVEEFGAEGSKWYVYTYEIYRDVFADGKDLVNGRYSIVLYGVDEAGNNNTNTLETVDGDQLYTAKVEFVLDTIAPVIITTGIESGEIYDAANKQMEIEIADSTPSTIQVSVNGQVVSMSSKDDVLSDDAIWLVQDEATGIYTLNVTEQNTLFGTQEIQIKALDAADNAAEAEVTDFTITTNWFVRYVNSSWLLITLAGLAVLIMLIIVVSKKKKKVEV